MKTMEHLTYDHFPDFLRKKLSEHYIERLEKEWKGAHMFRSPVPGNNAVILTSNDYLYLSGHPEVINA